MGSENTVVIKQLMPCRNEAIANAEIYPGHLIYLLSTGKVAVHATEGGRCERAFAVEDDIQGNGKTTAYAAAALVQYEIFRPGDVVNARIANGETIAIGDKVISAGDGTLKEADLGSTGEQPEDDVIGVAIEVCGMATSSAADPTWCKVRII